MFRKNITFKEINDGSFTLACTDLGAFKEIGNNKMPEGIDVIVIMEDRLPQFFLQYGEFEGEKDSTLNRHGPLKTLSTQQHLKELISELKDQRIRVFFGFWGNLYDPHSDLRVPLIESHHELWRLNNEFVQNTDMDPLVRLVPEQKNFADIIVQQFAKLKRDFNFDGLFLGDGFNGYRLFINPNLYEDQEYRKDDWTAFYKTIADGVHALNSQLLAYDCMGFHPDRALKHGADYLAQAQAGLDYLIIQTYPTAWGKKWLKKFDGFDFKSCKENLEANFENLKNTNCKVLYSLEMGDSVEFWKPKKRTTLKQLREFKDISDGKVLVWGNELLSRSF